MPLFKFLLFALSLILVGCNNQQIVGEWKRELNPNEVDTSFLVNSDWGDIEIREDSTFTMTGDTVTSFESSVPGWHMGGPMNGNWRLEENYLLLHTDDLPERFYLRFKIIQLTNTRLSLGIPTYYDDTAKAMKYTRK